jgi:hypothetical protein
MEKAKVEGDSFGNIVCTCGYVNGKTAKKCVNCKKLFGRILKKRLENEGDLKFRKMLSMRRKP